MRFKVTLLGTGTSHGVPVIGCGCAVCRSEDPRNQRTRASAWIRTKTTSVLIDVAPEHRQQALGAGLKRLDAVLLTHAHADHIAGMDDLRAYSQAQGKEIPCWGNAGTLAGVRERFGYVFRRTQKGGGKPRFSLKRVRGGWKIGDLRVTPVPLWHGRLKTLGYRIGNFAYLTDTNRIPESSFALLKGLDLLVLDGLRPRPHGTHFNFEQASAAAARIGARRTLLTHLTHLTDHARPGFRFPRGVRLAWDGMTFQQG